MEVIHLYLFLKIAHELIKKIKGLFSVTLLSKCKGLNFSRVEGVSRDSPDTLLQIRACNYYDYVCAPFNIFIKIFFYSHCLSFIFHVEETPFSFSACVETGNDGKYVAGKWNAPLSEGRQLSMHLGSSIVSSVALVVSSRSIWWDWGGGQGQLRRVSGAIPLLQDFDDWQSQVLFLLIRSSPLPLFEERCYVIVIHVCLCCIY